MTNEEFNAFKSAWENYPTQDNEGYQPDRGGFKCGWFAALEWVKSKQQQRDPLHNAGFDHPCRETCSGWKQGYDRGFDDGKKDCPHPGCGCVCGHQGKCPEDGPINGGKDYPID